MSDQSTLLLPPVSGPPGPEEQPPRRWRGWPIVISAVVTAVVLAIPLVLILVLRGDSGQPLVNPSPTGGPSPTLSAPRFPSPTATAGEQAPDGRIPLAELKNATVEIPPWPADNLTGVSGRLTFVDGQVLSPPDAAFPFERHIVIFDTTYGDVDRDGAQETLALIGCWVQGGSDQLVAFDRDRDGHIVTLATAVATTGDVRAIDSTTVRVLGDSTVTVKVGDFQRCCGNETPVLWQTRGYRWNGLAFRQVTGPAAFPVNPSVTETGMTAGDLVFGPAIGGWRYGALTVTVSYLRGARPDHLWLEFYVPADIQRDGSAWPPVKDNEYGGFYAQLPTPATGTSARYTFAFKRPASGTGGEFHLNVTGMTARDVRLSESNPYNNGPVVIMRIVD
jgi:hypothetical protein